MGRSVLGVTSTKTSIGAAKIEKFLGDERDIKQHAIFVPSVVFDIDQV